MHTPQEEQQKAAQTPLGGLPPVRRALHAVHSPLLLPRLANWRSPARAGCRCTSWKIIEPPLGQGTYPYLPGQLTQQGLEEPGLEYPDDPLDGDAEVAVLRVLELGVVVLQELQGTVRLCNKENSIRETEQQEATR